MIVRIRCPERQFTGTFALVVAHSYSCAECKYKAIARLTAAMHLNGKVIIISSLFLDETSSTLGIDFNLRNTRKANKLDETVNQLMDALGECLSPRQPTQTNSR